MQSRVTEVLRKRFHTGLVWRTSFLTGHGMYRLERNDSWNGRIHFGKQFLQMFWIIVAEEMLRNTAVSYSLNHRRMIASIGENLAAFNSNKL